MLLIIDYRVQYSVACHCIPYNTGASADNCIPYNVAYHCIPYITGAAVHNCILSFFSLSGISITYILTVTATP